MKNSLEILAKVIEDFYAKQKQDERLKKLERIIDETNTDTKDTKTK